MPCGPVRISDRKLSSATHTMGDTSRPLKGGTSLRVAFRMGSAALAVGGGAHPSGHAGGWGLQHLALACWLLWVLKACDQ